MPKGRQCVPSTKPDGLWYNHRGLRDEGPRHHASSTTTGIMLNAPLNAETSTYPPAPPSPYRAKDSKNFKLSNSFSAHVNRHSFQDHGVYFGDGRDSRTLGKRLTAPQIRQHTTDKSYLQHDGRQVHEYCYNSIYDDDYEGLPITDGPTKRRFPRIHAEGEPGAATMTTDTSTWFRDDSMEDAEPFKTPTQVLATSQEPFLPHNRWKYSNHGLPKIYPPYDRRVGTKMHPMWFMKGQQFMAVKEKHPYDMHGRHESRLYA